MREKREGAAGRLGKIGVPYEASTLVATEPNILQSRSVCRLEGISATQGEQDMKQNVLME